jgi:transcriptional regulator with XRE-family HTH domain
MREANAIAGTLGRVLRSTRRGRRLRQDQLGDLVGVSQAAISNLEAGRGSRTSIETWVALGIALDRPMAIGFSRDVSMPLNDAGHLEAQELAIRIAATAGWRSGFEVPVIAADRAGLTTDLVLERDGEILVLIEIWNRLDDFGAAVRSSDRKLAAVRGANPRRIVGSCWLLVDAAANHEIVRRFPAILRTRFRGSSAGWIRAIDSGSMPPEAPGIAWIDVRSGRLRELRLPT